MKVISVKEPFATLIRNGDKKIETRSWKTNYRGKLFIHASGKSLAKEFLNNDYVVNLIDKLVPHLHRLIGTEAEAHSNSSLGKVLLFVMAIAIHNLPEGIAAGVGFGSGDTSQALMIAGGIALQNIPEGMVIIGPMLAAGVTPKKTFICALLTGLIEVVGTLLGYFAVSISSVILPFALAFAGGTMLYVISDEMIPETHSHGSQRGATYALLVGFCIMLISDVLLG